MIYLVLAILGIIVFGFLIKNLTPSPLTSYIVTIAGTFVGVFLSMQATVYLQKSQKVERYTAGLNEFLRQVPESVFLLPLGKSIILSNKNSYSISEEFLLSMSMMKVLNYIYALGGSHETMKRQIESHWSVEDVRYCDFANCRMQQEDVSESLEYLTELSRDSNYSQSASWEFRRKLPLLVKETREAIKFLADKSSSFDDHLNVFIILHKLRMAVAFEVMLAEGQISTDEHYMCINGSFGVEDMIEKCVNPSAPFMRNPYFK